MIVSVSGEVALRPVREDDVALLEDLTQNPEKTGEFEWFGWSDLRRCRRGWDENGLIGPDGGTLIVTYGDQRLGLVNWRCQPITVPSSHCWEIGIVLLPEARAAVTARRRSACSLATCSRKPRCTASGRGPRWTTALSRALEKAGFTREGITRATGWRDGPWRDGVIYSVLRTDPAV
jgi:RimJ/RimL family protein N-acetyltransferase